MHSHVPGVQTVPRAELWALYQLLKRQDPNVHIQYYIDASYVVRAAKSTQTAAYTNGTNGDLWSRVYQLLHAPVSYTHLRAHETEADLVCRLLLEKKKT